MARTVCRFRKFTCLDVPKTRGTIRPVNSTHTQAFTTHLLSVPPDNRIRHYASTEKAVKLKLAFALSLAAISSSALAAELKLLKTPLNRIR
jgi:hypothetical protein